MTFQPRTKAEWTAIVKAEREAALVAFTDRLIADTRAADVFQQSQARLAERIANGTADCACCGIEKANCACRPGAICCRS